MADFPHPFPCRYNENARDIHCGSCEMVPDLLKHISQLKAELKRITNQTPCNAIKPTGWGTARRCVFKGPHTQHSWVNDL